jgi:hypothetical protein
MKLKEAFQHEFKDAKSYEDFKSTISSLNNLFYGLLFVSLCFMAATAPALFLIPVSLVTVMYIGRCINTLVNYIKTLIIKP